MSAPRNERREEQNPIEELVKEVELRQRNTTWPDAMVNASNADALMWKGSRRITKIQRIGVGIFGLLLVLGGVSIAASPRGEGWWIGIPIELGFIFVGCKLLWNSIRKNDPPQGGSKDE